ncbi:MAG: ATPase, T2SS/T4P/T4SS family [Acidimicrobiia bacterium]|nr:ATPase, T2SS/T4P/T4SS family [Acidimicrobiia bacterium]
MAALTQGALDRMRDIDRIVEGLVRSGAPFDRDSLQRHGRTIRADVAPLASDDAVEQAVDAIVGLGPIERLLSEDDITDVLVNGPSEIWVDRAGVLQRVDIRFRDDDDIVAMVRRVISPLGLRLDRAEPAVDARLPDGSRLHAVIPPASVTGPIVAIRRFRPSIASIDDLVRNGGVDQAMAADLQAAVAERRNILVSGPTGAGKTTLLNILCAQIDPAERVVTIEDAAELQLSGHAVRLETRRANVEGAGDVTMRDLVRHALRLRPDRIVVGEVRGAEALDMVQALNTGHSGSMSTIHANGPSEALVRLASLASMAPDRVPHDALTDLVRSAIDLVVEVARREGTRRVTGVHGTDDFVFASR